MTLDYGKIKKRILDVALIDGTNVKLTVPKKALFTQLSALKSSLEESEGYEGRYDRLLDVSAKILSNNIEGRTFSADDVDKIMDIEDMSLLITSYNNFANGITEDPNSESPATP